ncbi:transcription initiation factor TFIID subunit 11-like [Lineus longissimus]|uniref:transcription initiation factor TFIID subunit 11-like n=1 Tax=Lineus longissimus TaxID=88925 RepID=UPI00315D4977
MNRIQQIKFPIRLRRSAQKKQIPNTVKQGFFSIEKTSSANERKPDPPKIGTHSKSEIAREPRKGEVAKKRKHQDNNTPIGGATSEVIKRKRGNHTPCIRIVLRHGNIQICKHKHKKSQFKDVSKAPGEKVRFEVPPEKQQASVPLSSVESSRSSSEVAAGTELVSRLHSRQAPSPYPTPGQAPSPYPTSTTTTTATTNSRTKAPPMHTISESEDEEDNESDSSDESEVESSNSEKSTDEENDSVAEGDSESESGEEERLERGVKA